MYLSVPVACKTVGSLEFDEILLLLWSCCLKDECEPDDLKVSEK